MKAAVSCIGGGKQDPGISMARDHRIFGDQKVRCLSLKVLRAYGLFADDLMMDDCTIQTTSERARHDERCDKDFYFPDGNIILSARVKDGTLVYFRVHKSVLSLHSPIFADMFAMPLPSVTDTYDGLLLVHLQDDADDLKAFLQALYGGRSCFLLSFIVYTCAYRDVASCHFHRFILMPQKLWRDP